MAVSAGMLKFMLLLESNLGSKASAELKMLERANSSAQASTQGLDRAVQGAAQGLGRMAQIAQQTASSTLRQAGYIDQLRGSYDRLRSSMQAVASISRQAAAGAVERAPQALAAGTAFTAMASKPVAAFATLEEATTDLKVVMTGADKKLSPAFDEIMKVAMDMGNKLPGATKDFVAAARALKEQGTPDEVIAKGGLRAAGGLGVLLGMDQYSAAEMVAKTREAFGLKDNELVKAADQTQRARFAFGMKPQDILAANSYMSAQLNTMGVVGLENMKKVQAIQGMAAGVGLEASSFGTNFAMMLTRLNQVDKRTSKGKEGKEVGAMLDEYGIDLSFFDNKGQFAGIDNMVEQLAKLKPLSQSDRMKVLERMFGVEAGRPAAILVEKGAEAYREAQRKTADQADMDTRIQMKVETYKGKSDAAKGTLENVMAAMGAPIAEALKPVIDSINEKLGSAQVFFEKNKAAGAAATIGGGLVAAAAAYGASGYLLSLLRGRAGAGAAGGLGGLLGGGAGGLNGLKLPLPVYVVNKQMSLTREAMMGGAPAGGVGGAAGGAAGKVPAASTGGVVAAGAAAASAGKLSGAANLLNKVAGSGLAVAGVMALTATAANAAAINADENLNQQQKDNANGSLGGQVIGSLAGAGVGKLAGMATGAAIGSAVPVVGTLLGGIVGLLAGSYLGGKGSEMLGPQIAGFLAKRRDRIGGDGGDAIDYGDAMTGMMGGTPSLLTPPAYLTATTANTTGMGAQALEAFVKQPTKVELQPGRITIDIKAPPGYSASGTGSMPGFTLDMGATLPGGA